MVSLLVLRDNTCNHVCEEAVSVDRGALPSPHARGKSPASSTWAPACFIDQAVELITDRRQLEPVEHRDQMIVFHHQHPPTSSSYFEQRPQQLGWGDGVGNRRWRPRARADDDEVTRVDNTLEPVGGALVNRDLAPGTAVCLFKSAATRPREKSVRNRLAAGGRGIRTAGPAREGTGLSMATLMTSSPFSFSPERLESATCSLQKGVCKPLVPASPTVD
jgi:hypothetical protein